MTTRPRPGKFHRHSQDIPPTPYGKNSHGVQVDQEPLGYTPPKYNHPHAIVPHSPEEKKRVIARLRRIRGQSEALERAVQAGTDCGALLQQLAALRGATTGLMGEVLESHLRETLAASGASISAEVQAELDQLMRIVRTNLK